MKYVVIVGDGMADLGKATPMMVAKKPFMNKLAKEGITGLVSFVPDKMEAGSAVANMSIFGYNPKIYYQGRAPLEAANIGVNLLPEDVAYRCNLVTVQKNIMIDFSAGHISTEDADRAIKMLNQKLSSDRIKFYTGTSYRNLLVIKDGPLNFQATPPHDITGKDVRDYQPKGDDSTLIKDLMDLSKTVFLGKYPSQIWIWGQGKKAIMPSFKSKFGLDGGVITAVDLIKGIAKTIGLKSFDIPGATGYFDTDYQAKADYAINLLQEADFAFVHLEPPDEAGHLGNREEKIKAIENIDKIILGTILEKLPKIDKDFRILITADHPTPLEKMTHTSDPVPFLLYGNGIKTDNASSFDELSVNQANYLKDGYKLIETLFAKD